jgi:hypothetical protein
MHLILLYYLFELRYSLIILYFNNDLKTILLTYIKDLNGNFITARN